MRWIIALLLTSQVYADKKEEKKICVSVTDDSEWRFDELILTAFPLGIVAIATYLLRIRNRPPLRIVIPERVVAENRELANVPLTPRERSPSPFFDLFQD